MICKIEQERTSLPAHLVGMSTPNALLSLDSTILATLCGPGCRGYRVTLVFWVVRGAVGAHHSYRSPGFEFSSQNITYAELYTQQYIL